MNSNQPRAAGTPGKTSTVANPGKPKSSGYAEPRPKGATDPGKPNPEVAGDEASQIAPAAKSEDIEYPSDATDNDAAAHDSGVASENIEYPSGAAPLDGL
jgi:hypothetical protein